MIFIQAYRLVALFFGEIIFTLIISLTNLFFEAMKPFMNNPANIFCLQKQIYQLHIITLQAALSYGK